MSATSSFDEDFDQFFEEAEQQTNDPQGEEEQPLDMSEFYVQGDGYEDTEPAQQQVQAPNGVDPLELQRRLYIAEGQNQAYRSLFGDPQPQQQQQGPHIPEYAFDPAETELTEDEEEAIQHSRPLIEKLVKKQINNIYGQHITPLHRQVLEQQMYQQQVVQQQNYQRAKDVHSTLHREIPGLAEMAATPEFARYLKQPHRGNRAYTIEQVMMGAIQRGDVESVKDMMEDFRPSHKRPGSQNIAPGRSQSSVPPTQGRKQRMFAYSAIDKAYNDFDAGLITRAEFDRKRAAFEQAELAGLIDYNA